MKGLVLAGGVGSRLRPITHTAPKQLVPLGNKPVLEHAIDDLRNAGITEVGIVLGNRGSEEIQEYFGTGEEFGVEITYIFQGEPLGIGHAVGCARDFVGDEPFTVYLGDNVLVGDIADFVGRFDPAEHSAGITLNRVSEPSKYGIAVIDDDGSVRRLIEKPDDSPSDLAVCGIYVFSSSVFDHVESTEPSARGELEITDVIQSLLDAGEQIYSYELPGEWKDTGTPDGVLAANRLVLERIERDVEGQVVDGAVVEGRVELGEESIVEEGAVVRGPVSIGDHTRVRSGSVVGPNVTVGNECVLEDVHIESSVVFDRATIRCEQTVESSLISREAEIRTSDSDSSERNRFIIGRDATVEL